MASRLGRMSASCLRISGEGEFKLELRVQSLSKSSSSSSSKAVGTELSMVEVGRVEELLQEIHLLRQEVASLKEELRQKEKDQHQMYHGGILGRMEELELPIPPRVCDAAHCGTPPPHPPDVSSSAFSGKDKHTLEILPNLHVQCTTEPSPTEAQDFQCDIEKFQMKVVELPMLSLHCYTQPQPVEMHQPDLVPVSQTDLLPLDSLDSDVKVEGQHSDVSSVKVCMVKVEDYKKAPELSRDDAVKDEMYSCPEDMLMPSTADVQTSTYPVIPPPVSEDDQQRFYEHLKQQSSDPNMRHKPFQCPLCQKCFSSKKQLAPHLRLHTGEKPYKCSRCDQAFIRSDILKIHQRIHKGQRQPLWCSICGKHFSQASRLKNHQIIHTGEKPYRCFACEKRFSDRSTLRYHERLHTGEKPYHCSQCGKNFIKSSNLHSHLKVHAGKSSV